jgi:hypothetical protein
MNSKYNDGLDNEVRRQVITTYRRPKTEREIEVCKDMGTLIGTQDTGSAEMYKRKRKRISDSLCLDFTFQQSNENVGAQSAPIAGAKDLSESKAVRPEENVVSKGKFRFRQVSNMDHYVRISIAVNKTRIGNRYSRQTAYISLQDIDDTKYTIFMRSFMTTAHDEIKRALLKFPNSTVMPPIAHKMMQDHPECLIGLLKYNPRRGKAELFHKANRKCGVISVYVENNELMAHLWLLGTDYYVKLNKDHMTQDQNKYYEALGIWQDLDIEIIDDGEE